jgi:hypothetical protein
MSVFTRWAWMLFLRQILHFHEENEVARSLDNP